VSANTTRGTRTAARTALLNAVRASALLPSGVAVLRGWSGIDFRNNQIYVARVEGNVELPSIMGGRQERRDTYEMTVLCQAAGPLDRTGETCEAACETYMDAVLDVIANADTAGGLIDQVPGLWIVEPGRTEGPDPEATEQGYVAFGTVVVRCVANTD